MPLYFWLLAIIMATLIAAWTKDSRAEDCYEERARPSVVSTKPARPTQPKAKLTVAPKPKPQPQAKRPSSL